MSAYIVAVVNVHNQDEYEKYIQGWREPAVREALRNSDGRFLVIDEAPVALEGAWPCTRTMLLRFPDEASATLWYESGAYQEIAQHRFHGADTNMVLLKGLE